MSGVKFENLLAGFLGVPPRSGGGAKRGLSPDDLTPDLGLQAPLLLRTGRSVLIRLDRSQTDC